MVTYSTSFTYSILVLAYSKLCATSLLLSEVTLDCTLIDPKYVYVLREASVMVCIWPSNSSTRCQAKHIEPPSSDYLFGYIQRKSPRPRLKRVVACRHLDVRKCQ